MALAATQKVIFSMVDAGTKEGTTSLNITMDAGSDPTATVAAYVDLLNSASSCKVKSVVGQTAANGNVGTSETNEYNVRDKLAVEWLGSQNDHHIMMVGDLDPEILDATNMDRVDPTNANWLTFKGVLESNMVDKLGASIKVIRGFRARSRNLRLKTLAES